MIEFEYKRKSGKIFVLFVLDLYINLNSNDKQSLQQKFYTQKEDNKVLDETEMTFNLNNNHSLTETGFDIIDILSPSEHQFQIQE